jgi:hypothetical protein
MSKLLFPTIVSVALACCTQAASAASDAEVTRAKEILGHTVSIYPDFFCHAPLMPLALEGHRRRGAVSRALRVPGGPRGHCGRRHA